MASKQDQPPWLEMVHRFERAIGEPVEAFVRSDAYFDLMTQVNRGRAQLTRAFEGMWEEWLHLFNLPAATDIRRLREQLSRLERQVNRMAKDLADREEAGEKPPPPSAAKPRPARAARSKSSRTSGP